MPRPRSGLRGLRARCGENLTCNRRPRRDRGKDSPDYLELMFGIWHPPAAVPANAKLHGLELAYIWSIRRAGLLCSKGLDTEIAPQCAEKLWSGC